MKLKRLLLIPLILLAVITFTACDSEAMLREFIGTNPEQAEVKEEKIDTKWMESLKDAGYTDAEVKDAQELLDSLGITQIHIMDYSEDGTGTMRAKIFDSERIRMNVVFDQHKIISVQLLDIPVGTFMDDREDHMHIKNADLSDIINDPYIYTEDDGIMYVIDWGKKTIAGV